MIGTVNGLDGLGSLAASYLAQQTQAATGVDASGTSTGTGGTVATTQSTATISGPGQLLSDLQELQTQDPTKFQQVVSQIADQLTAASQQTQGTESTALSTLAAKFQNVANSGNLSQLQPQHHHRGHGHHAYSQDAQSPSQGVASLGQPSGSPPASGTDLQQLFSTISSEVNSALGGQTTAS